MVWKKQKMSTSSKMQPLVLHCLLQAKPFHLCHCEKKREREEEEKEVTSTWTTACLCLLKAHKSPPSRASFWCCHPPACHIAPASGSLQPGRLGESDGRRASTGPKAVHGKHVNAQVILKEERKSTHAFWNFMLYKIQYALDFKGVSVYISYHEVKNSDKQKITWT